MRAGRAREATGPEAAVGRVRRRCASSRPASTASCPSPWLLSNTSLVRGSSA